MKYEIEEKAKIEMVINAFSETINDSDWLDILWSNKLSVYFKINYWNKNGSLRVDTIEAIESCEDLLETIAFELYCNECDKLGFKNRYNELSENVYNQVHSNVVEIILKRVSGIICEFNWSLFSYSE